MKIIQNIIESVWSSRRIGYTPFNGKASFAPEGNYIAPNREVWTSFEGVWTNA